MARSPGALLTYIEEIKKQNPNINYEKFLHVLKRIFQISLAITTLAFILKYYHIIYYLALNMEEEYLASIRVFRIEATCNGAYVAFVASKFYSNLMYTFNIDITRLWNRGAISYFFRNLYKLPAIIVYYMFLAMKYGFNEMFAGGHLEEFMEFLNYISLMPGSFATDIETGSACTALADGNQYPQAIRHLIDCRENCRKNNSETVSWIRCMGRCNIENKELFPRITVTPSYGVRFWSGLTYLNQGWNIFQYIFILLPAAFSKDYVVWLVRNVSQLPEGLQILVWISLISPIG